MAMFEYIDTLKVPYDIFMFDTNNFELPIRAHWHYYIEAIFLYDGEVTIEYNNTPYVLKKGELILIFPKVVHSIYKHLDIHVRYGVIKFNFNELNLSKTYSPTLHALFSPTKIHPDIFIHFSLTQLAPYKINELFTRCITETASTNFGHNIITNGLLSILLISITRIWKDSQIDLNTVAKSEITNNNFFDNIIEYIDCHSNETLSVQVLAAKSNMSYSNFSKIFKKQTGRSCKEYIEYVKVCKAQDMLLFTDFSLCHIASETGFSDCSHFIKTYKKLKGLTPNQQRKIGFSPSGS